MKLILIIINVQFERGILKKKKKKIRKKKRKGKRGYFERDQ